MSHVLRHFFFFIFFYMNFILISYEIYQYIIISLNNIKSTTQAIIQIVCVLSVDITRNNEYITTTTKKKNNNNKKKNERKSIRLHHGNYCDSNGLLFVVFYSYLFNV